LEALLLPLLSILYNASGRTPSQMYMLLIIILILSQDAAFARNIHSISVPSVPWYKDRHLTNTTLGESTAFWLNPPCRVGGD
jgi:dymeclin